MAAGSVAEASQQPAGLWPGWSVVAGAALLYLGLALFQLYPAWLDLGHGVVGDWIHPDMISNHWLYRWVAEELPAGGSIVHNDRYYLPIGDAPWLAGNGSDAIPYLLVGTWLPWPGSMTVWALLIVVLNGLSGLALARAAGVGRAGAVVAGAMLAMSPYVAFELGCARYAQAPLYWMGFFLATWLRLLQRPRLLTGVVAGLLYGAASFGYWYYGLWMALAGALIFLFQPRWRALLAFLPTALLTTLPPLAFFLSRWAEIPGAAEADFPHPLAVESGLFPGFPLWGGSGGRAGLILPLLLLLLAALGARRVERWMRAGLLVVAGTFYLLALGPEIPWIDGTSTGLPGPFVALYGLTGALRRYWWPYRHIAVLTLALVPLAGMGAQLLLARLGRWAPAGVLLLVALLPLDLGLRSGTTAVAASWWEEPTPYLDLAALPGDALLELPIAPAIAGSQQSLSYQWAHKKKLVNGHAMWVDRVRPAAWDEWVEDNSLLHGLQLAELGDLDGVLEIQAADVAALRDQGLRYIVLNSEYFPGALGQILPIHNHILVSLFGEPVLSWKNVVIVWDLDGYDGVTSVSVAHFAPPDDYVSVDGTVLPKNATTSSLGWRPFPRGKPTDLPESRTERIADEDAAMPAMLRRKLDREKRQERRRLQQRGAGDQGECGEDGSECPAD